MKNNPAYGKQNQILTKTFGNKRKYNPAPNGNFNANIGKGMSHEKAAIAD